MTAQEFIEGRQTVKRLKKLPSVALEEIANTKVRALGGRGNIYQYTKTGPRADLGGLVTRSNWEANVARVLTIHGIKFEFEPRTFFFPVKRGVRGYVPDFYLPKTNEYIEVKGFFDDKSRIKLKRLSLYYPEEFENLTMVISKGSTIAKSMAAKLGIRNVLYYEEFRHLYKPLIKTWEGK